MKKTLLIAAAALAAGIISTEAQVYSQNIVGYVNTTLVSGFNAVAVPLDISAGNNLTNVLNNSTGQLDYTLVYLWNGAGYTIYTLDSGMATGVADSQDNNPVTSPTIAPGQLFFFNKNNTGSVTNTIAGTVHVDGAGVSTNVVGVTTNTLPAGAYSFVSSKMPVAGGVSTVLGLDNSTGALNYTLLYIPNIVNGVFLG